jgi:hypothetical protein
MGEEKKYCKYTTGDVSPEKSGISLLRDDKPADEVVWF